RWNPLLFARHSSARWNPLALSVIPAQAGIHVLAKPQKLDSSVRWNDGDENYAGTAAAAVFVAFADTARWIACAARLPSSTACTVRSTFPPTQSPPAYTLGNDVS